MWVRCRTTSWSERTSPWSRLRRSRSGRRRAMTRRIRQARYRRGVRGRASNTRSVSSPCRPRARKCGDRPAFQCRRIRRAARPHCNHDKSPFAPRWQDRISAEATTHANPRATFDPGPAVHRRMHPGCFTPSSTADKHAVFRGMCLSSEMRGGPKKKARRFHDRGKVTTARSAQGERWPARAFSPRACGVPGRCGFARWSATRRADWRWPHRSGRPPPSGCIPAHGG